MTFTAIQQLLLTLAEEIGSHTYTAALSKQPMCRTGRYEGSHDPKETPPHPGHRQVKRGVHIKVWFLLSQLKEPPPVPQEPSESVWEASHCGPEFVAWEPAPAFFSFFFSFFFWFLVSACPEAAAAAK